MEIACVADLERQAKERLAGHADGAHQLIERCVRADQDVLAVVELLALRLNAPRTTAGNASRLEDDDAHAALGQRYGGGHAGVARTDDRYAAIQVRQAIHNLRSGVSDVRRDRTRKPSRSISSSSPR